MNNDDLNVNKNVKHKFDVVSKIWLRNMLRNITLIPPLDEEVKNIRALLDKVSVDGC